MHIATAELKSVSPYSQSRAIEAEKAPGESHDAFRERTWRQHMHVDPNGIVFIPPAAFKNGIADAAAFLGLKIKGDGQSRWKKHFESGVMVGEPVSLGIKASDVVGEMLFLPSDGIRGSGKRVWKTYPLIHSWHGTVPFLIVDDKITAEIFEQHLRVFGQLIGIGRYRPRNNGYYGRFEVKKFKWE